jgi:hypothetical protein
MKILFVLHGQHLSSALLAEAIARKIAIERGVHRRGGVERRHERLTTRLRPPTARCFVGL